MIASFDGGATLSVTAPHRSAGVGAFAIDPAGRTIYAGTDGDGVVSFKLSR